MDSRRKTLKFLIQSKRKAIRTLFIVSGKYLHGGVTWAPINIHGTCLILLPYACSIIHGFLDSQMRMIGRPFQPGSTGRSPGSLDQLFTSVSRNIIWCNMLDAQLSQTFRGHGKSGVHTLVCQMIAGSRLSFCVCCRYTEMRHAMDYAVLTTTAGVSLRLQTVNNGKFCVDTATLTLSMRLNPSLKYMPTFVTYVQSISTLVQRNVWEWPANARRLLCTVSWL